MARKNSLNDKRKSGNNLSKNTTEKAGFKENLYKKLDIFPDVLPFESHVDIRGRNCVEISGAKKIVTYTENLIRLKLKKGNLCIEGNRLICISYYYGKVGVEGKILCVRFEDTEK